MVDIKGFSFIEFTSQDIDQFHDLFLNFGFMFIHEGITDVGKIRIYQQGNIRFIVNNSSQFENKFASLHGPSVCSFGFSVSEPKKIHKNLIELAATDASPDDSHPAIEGIGGSRLYLNKSFKNLPKGTGLGLESIDHITHNVYQGNMDKWAKFYEEFFDFEQIRFFDIKGEITGLKSRAMAHGSIAIPINEDTGDIGQIAEYLKEYNGEGVQHIALLTDDIYPTVEQMKKNGIEFLDVSDTYYDMIEERIPNHGEDLERMKANKILIDGKEDELLLQIFTKTYIGPVFFEIIQRKNNKGFGEGNFQALFDSIERDQMRRGVLDG